MAVQRHNIGADEIIVVPEDRVALLRAPLEVSENDHCDGRPVLAAHRRHFVHGNAKCAVAREADDGHIR